MLPLRKILCPTDYSESAYVALDKAIELASHFGAELYVLHVVPTLTAELEPGVYAGSDYDRERLAANREKLNEVIAERTPVELKTHPLVRLGNAADEINRVAGQEGVDLIVIATHGTTGWRHLVYGSVTERVLHFARCPVLVIPASRE